VGVIIPDGKRENRRNPSIKERKGEKEGKSKSEKRSGGGKRQEGGDKRESSPDAPFLSKMITQDLGPSFCLLICHESFQGGSPATVRELPKGNGTWSHLEAINKGSPRCLSEEDDDEEDENFHK